MLGAASATIRRLETGARCREGFVHCLRQGVPCSSPVPMTTMLPGLCNVDCNSARNDAKQARMYDAAANARKGRPAPEPNLARKPSAYGSE